MREPGDHEPGDRRYDHGDRGDRGGQGVGQARSEETSLGLHDLDPSLCLYPPNVGELKFSELRF
jgi:hypothetical protein